MPFRTAVSQPGKLELLEHRLMLSQSPATNDENFIICSCPICSGSGAQAVHDDGHLKSRDENALNPTGIHRRPPAGSNDPGNISGFIWLDQNADGEIDLAEGGLFNQTVFLDENDNGELDDGERSTVTNPNGYYVFKDVEPGTYTVRQVRWEKLNASFPASDRYSVTLASADDFVADQNFGNNLSKPIVVDYLFVYTREARIGAGGHAGMDEAIRDMIASANSAFVNSEINVQLNLVGSRETNYLESQDGRVDLKRLQAKGEGFLNEVYALRDAAGADMVTLVAEDISAGFGLLGISSFPYERLDKDAFGFNVVRRYQATSEMVFIHEVGHNFGAGHFHDDGGAFDYSHGNYIDVGNNRYHSIMSYHKDEYQTALPYFSNPDLTYKGVALGDSATADNARTIRKYAKVVAGYRQRDLAGNNRSTAHSFGAINSGSVAVIRDSVGDTDQYDVYKFTLDDPTRITARAFRFSHNAEMQLLEGKRVIENSRRPGKKAERIELDLDAGTYFVRVYHGGGNKGTNYTFKLVGEGPEASARSTAMAAGTAKSPSLFARDTDNDSDEEETSLVDLV